MNFDQPGIHIFAGFKGIRLEEELKNLIEEIRPGGIVLFRRNVESPQQVKDLVAGAQELARAKLGRPLLVAIDQEGGTVQRLAPHFTRLPSADSLASQGASAITQWTTTAAADLKEIGVQINFAPVLDIVPEMPDHFMFSRSLGSAPETVSRLGKTWIDALQDHGISATAKHFPGLGRAELDPHHFSPAITEDSPEEFRRHLIPFQAAIDAGVHCIMTSHAVYPAMDPGRPATLSRIINHTWLRERMGFTGVLFSDDLDMAAICENYPPETVIRKGFECSLDFFLLCQKSESIEPFYRELTDRLRDDSGLRDAHSQSLKRIAKLFRIHFPE